MKKTKRNFDFVLRYEAEIAPGRWLPVESKFKVKNDFVEAYFELKKADDVRELVPLYVEIGTYKTETRLSNLIICERPLV